MTTSAEDGFHEIQLTGKQLVFLFMATTVVAVVIFLCGVLVGRGVRAERATADVAAATEIAVGNPESVPPAAPATQSAEPLPATGEDLSYAKRLQGDEPKEQLKPNAEAPVADSTPEPPTPDEAAPEKPQETAPRAGAAAIPSQGSQGATPETGDAWVVQVAALRDRAAAVAIIQRLSRKGFQAFIVEPTRGAPAPGFRVRVGPFQDRRQAEQVARRLEREEQFKPFITR